jgi:hypothetical protein
LNLNQILIKFIIYYIVKLTKENGDWGLGIGDWGLGIGPNPQSPIPNPQIPNPHSTNLRLNKNIYNIQ